MDLPGKKQQVHTFCLFKPEVIDDKSVFKRVQRSDDEFVEDGSELDTDKRPWESDIDRHGSDNITVEEGSEGVSN